MSDTPEPTAPPLRMSAYYYSFEPTGVEAVDRILSAVAHAGKGFHHTENWWEEIRESPPFHGTNFIDWIQNAAKEAAARIAALEAEVARLTEKHVPVAWMIRTAQGEAWDANMDRFAMEHSVRFYNADVAQDSRQPFRLVPLYELASPPKAGSPVQWEILTAPELESGPVYDKPPKADPSASRASHFRECADICQQVAERQVGARFPLRYAATVCRDLILSAIDAGEGT